MAGHAHSHGHVHSHGHSHGPTTGRAFAIGIVLNIAFVLIEASYGYAAHSLALVADAGHNLSDVLGLVLAWGATVLAARRPTSRHTYGLRRASILAALGNAMLLLVAVGGIAWEAVRRFGQPEPVAGITVMIVAGIGIVINVGTALLFMARRHEDLNVRGAFLHMIADAAVSLGVVIAGLLTLATGWAWIDPVTSLLIAAVILLGTWSLLRESLDLALDAVPNSIDMPQIQSYLRELPGIDDVHDLHVWALSTTETALTAHIVAGNQAQPDILLQRINTELHDRFGIEHATIQLETRRCETCCAEPIMV